MVSFICGVCATTLKKNQVNRHCESCRAAWVFTCVDCGKDFEGFGFDAHTSCVTEAEKYHGKFYTPKNGKPKVWPGFKSFLSSRLKAAGTKGILISELLNGLRENYTGSLSMKEAEEVMTLRFKHRKYRLETREEGVFAVYRKITQ